MASPLSKVGKLDVARTALLICDMQEKFRPTISHFTAVTEVASRMLAASRILKMQTIITEMYPKGLGSTVAEVGDLSGLTVIPKTRFSMCTKEVEPLLFGGTSQSRPIDSVLLCGIEAHVCVQATALELVGKGIDVHCIADACSSRNPVDRMRQSGVFITTCESALLTLLNGSDHPDFKAVQRLIMNMSPDSGLLNPQYPTTKN